MGVLIAGCVLAGGLHGAGLALHRQDLQLTQALAVGGSIAVGDFNGDGRPDLVGGMAGGLAVMLNLGHGTFGPAISTGILQPAPAAIADFNHDGKLDLAAAGQIVLGRGDGTFEPPRPMSPTWFVAEAADFNGDGLPDLAVVQTGACGNDDPACSLLFILLGNGDGTFRSADRARIVGGYKPLAADFNRDGKPDLAVSFGNAIAVFLGNGDGSFRALGAIALLAGTFTGTPLAADLNGDGILDLVSRSHELFGLGDGTFQPPIPYARSAAASTPIAVQSGGVGAWRDYFALQSACGHCREWIFRHHRGPTCRNGPQLICGVVEVDPVLAPVVAIRDQFELLSSQGMVRVGYLEVGIGNVTMRCS